MKNKAILQNLQQMKEVQVFNTYSFRKQVREDKITPFSLI